MEEGARIASRLRQQGLHVSEDFVRAAAAGETLGDSERTVYRKCLDCDFNVCGLGCLPSNVESWDKQVLAGTVVLQVDELVDMAASAKQRCVVQPVQSVHTCEADAIFSSSCPKRHASKEEA